MDSAFSNPLNDPGSRGDNGKWVMAKYTEESWHKHRLGQLTSLTRCPGVLEMAQLHSFLLGYLSGQLGLVMVPLVDVTLWSQPAVQK